MNNYETNFFQIKNCDKLTASYRLFEIIGLSNQLSNYDSHIQTIIRKLSYRLSHPVTVISKAVDGESKDFLVIKDEKEVIDRVSDVFESKAGLEIYFRKTDEVFYLNFSNYDESTREICRRFLQFSLNNEISKNSGLWSPGAGKPFFSKNPLKVIDGIAIFRGFIARIIEMPMGGWGIEIALTRKYVSEKPLPFYLTRNEFERLSMKGDVRSHFIYHYGSKWYETRLDEFSDLDASQYKFRRQIDNEKVSVIQDLHEQYKSKEMPPEITNLPDNVSLLVYRNNKDEERRIPAALCYKVLDTDEIKDLHKTSIIEPFFRRKEALIARKNYLKSIRFGNDFLNVSDSPLLNKIDIFQYPDQAFANNKILSTRGTKGAIQTKVDFIGEKRKHLLNDGGCYINSPFEPQYFFMPETIAKAYGKTFFIKDLKREVNKMHPSQKGWNPIIIEFDDRNFKKVHELANEIMRKIYANINMGGFAIIMLPDLALSKRTHDELAAICVSKCAQLKPMPIEVAIMHTKHLQKCVKYNVEENEYKIIKEGSYRAYVKGVALNKVLLNNKKYPFVLATPLHADLTIGIDVKKSIAGYVFVDKYAQNICPIRQKSKRPEQLSEEQVFAAFFKNISHLAQNSEYPILKIVVHRDGRIFKSELNGIQRSIKCLVEKGVLPENVEITIAEIPKYSVISLRLFEIRNEYNILTTQSDNNNVLNPKIGSWMILNQNEGFVATTGREFKHEGSCKPLYVKKAFGTMKLGHILEDVFFLSTLSHTKPDDCSRNPITIKMADNLINDYGGGYDEELYESEEILISHEL